jgi:CheY-like chemotaxis protein/tetratricopeptide (TPR) repeat protein
MYLATELLRELDNPDLSVSERALLRCRLARHQERAGDYDAAAEALGELWRGVGARPMLKGLDDKTKASVLLRVGALTGWIGGAGQMEGSQEAAKDLISESLRTFAELGLRNKVGEARSDLALCYWREGAFDEARITLQEALGEFDESNVEQRAVALIRSALVERTSNRLSESLRIYKNSAPLFEEMGDHLVTATFHNGYANVLNRLSSVEERRDYVDLALIEYAAASFHFEQAGHERFQGCVENNLGFLFSIIGKFDDAHEHLDRAQMIYTRLKDDHVAQIDETRARVLLAEGRTVEAEKTARAAVLRLEKGDELYLLAEALTTHGIAVARLGHQAQARAALERAVSVAEQAGDFECAGLAALTLVEQLGTNLSNEDVWIIIHHAGLLLEKTQDVAILRRLAKAFLALHEVLAPNDWTNFSLRNAVHGYEGHMIKLALKETGGSVTRAARVLGFKHHQSLISLINIHHKNLLTTRSVVRKRRRHLISHPKRNGKREHHSRKQSASETTILHVEDNKAVARLIQETLGVEGMHVDACLSGTTALEILRSDAPYDLIIVDNDLPGLSGLELVLRVQTMAHRRNTPVIMLSGDDCEAEAWRAGVKAFLRKPEAVDQVSSTIKRLLEQRKGRTD